MDKLITELIEQPKEGSHFRDPGLGPLPSAQNLDKARKVIAETSNKLPLEGLGIEKVAGILTNDILPALPNQSSHYYGFVTGGATPAARLADHLAVWADTMPQVHLPEESVSTDVEDAALKLLLDLLKLERTQWLGRTITTGATASNVLALACARDWLVGSDEASIAEHGFANALKASGVQDIKIYVCKSHSSIGKAASIVGLGRKSVVEISDAAHLWNFDIAKLEEQLISDKSKSIRSIICANFGEVNTGQYTQDIKELRRLCDQYKAWLHIDGAFGVYLRALADKYDSAYHQLAQRVTAGLELADSITGDSHKTLNVPYDSGVFFTKHKELLQHIFHNPGAVYLSGTSDSIPSPLNIGIENSRRFRALAVYSTLLAYGEAGYSQFIERIIRFSQRLSAWIHQSPDYELLLESPKDAISVVLFRAKDTEANKTLKQRINQSGKIYVSGTVWNGSPAVRIAPCNWNIADGDEQIVINVLSTF
ncbi:hypothetical protein AWJ20_3952 [Sugiyamaella lignohabitans]|uniref:L-2,4-diaminobutyrate decarboxylase n=1 Tax=Sugiyamaella lignohabitans TaxID=796027 RepID=A0A167C2W7_9ASCO|nr:uncharacterized protein AWJ20_3952 [Sugiyamaella lignohabitans]ANB11152.1 hypothetical protein AWJ20_3952 [Sugiyamaella lignohabitans]